MFQSLEGVPPPLELKEVVPPEGRPQGQSLNFLERVPIQDISFEQKIHPPHCHMPHHPLPVFAPQGRADVLGVEEKIRVIALFLQCFQVFQGVAPRPPDALRKQANPQQQDKPH